MKTYEFKLYRAKRNRYLHTKINASARIYNHCIALHKRYYRMFGKYLNCAKLQKHIAKLRNRNPYWQEVGSQAVQDICQRIDRAYQNFFKHHDKGFRPPTFKKTRKYKSFTLKQAGYKFLGGNRLKIGHKVFQFWKSREIEGKVKTVTVKRNPLNELFIYVTVDNVAEPQNKVMTGKIAGFDFGLKTFLKCSQGPDVKAPEFLKASLNKVRRASKRHSTKRKGSRHRELARQNLARQHDNVANRRSDWFWKLAHELTSQYDVLCFETLNLKGMQRLWGRKISDLAFRDFLKILEWVAIKKGKQVVFIDRWFPSSKQCSNCGHVMESLDLSVRHWRCPACNAAHDRDDNAALNIQIEGASSIGLGNVRRAKPAVAV